MKLYGKKTTQDHYWLSKTNYNYGISAEVEDGHTIDELKKSYGQISPEKI